MRGLTKICERVGTDIRYWRFEDGYVNENPMESWYSGELRMMARHNELEDAVQSDGERYCSENQERWGIRPLGPGPGCIKEAELEQPEIDRVLAPRNAKHVVINREYGRGSRSEVINPFLSSRFVDHELGEVTGWKAAFTARAFHEDGPIVGACVLGRPSARMLDDGSVGEITRLAGHELLAPSNLNSKLLGAATKWAQNNTEFDDIITYSGVDNNPGTCYEAAGFEVDDVTEDAEGDGRLRQGKGRTVYQDGGEWVRTRWKTAL